MVNRHALRADVAHNSVQISVPLEKAQDILGRIQWDTKFGEGSGDAKGRNVA